MSDEWRKSRPAKSLVEPAYRRSRIFKEVEPSSTGISQIIWTPKPKPQPKQSVSSESSSSYLLSSRTDGQSLSSAKTSVSSEIVPSLPNVVDQESVRNPSHITEEKQSVSSTPLTEMATAVFEPALVDTPQALSSPCEAGDQLEKEPAQTIAPFQTTQSDDVHSQLDSTIRLDSKLANVKEEESSKPLFFTEGMPNALPVSSPDDEVLQNSKGEVSQFFSEAGSLAHISNTNPSMNHETAYDKSELAPSVFEHNTPPLDNAHLCDMEASTSSGPSNQVEDRDSTNLEATDLTENADVELVFNRAYNNTVETSVVVPCTEFECFQYHVDNRIESKSSSLNLLSPEGPVHNETASTSLESISQPQSTENRLASKSEGPDELAIGYHSPSTSRLDSEPIEPSDPFDSSIPESSSSQPFSPTFSDETIASSSGPHTPIALHCDPIPPMSPTESAWTELEDTSVFGDSTVSFNTQIFPLLKKIERLKLGIVQLRNFTVHNDNAQLVVNVKIDTEEVFQSATVAATSNCIFGDESTCELSAKFYALHLFVTEMLDGGRLTRQIGRVTLKRRDLINLQPFDDWLPVSTINTPSTTEILGDMCLDVAFDIATKALSVRVLDYTVWPSGSNPLGESRQLDLPSCLSKIAAPGGLFLRICVSADKAFSPMKKSRVIERRTLETVRLDTSNLMFSKTEDVPQDSKVNTVQETARIRLSEVPKKNRQSKPRPVGPTAMSPSTAEDARRVFGGVGTSISSTSASSSTATTPNWHAFEPTSPKTPKTPNSGTLKRQSENVFFPTTAAPLRESQTRTPSNAASRDEYQPQMRLNIKVYSEASFDESSYCGYVRVPLDNSTMLPKNLPLGPNWFHIKSRITNSALDALTRPSKGPQTPKTAIKNQAPGPLRHSSSPSTSSSLPQHSKSTGQLKSSVAATRSQPLRPTLNSAPSLASLKGLLTGNTIGSASRTLSPTSQIRHRQPPPRPTTTCQQPNPKATTSVAMKKEGANAAMPTNNNKMGEMRVKLWYSVDEVLPLIHYQPLYSNLIKSLSAKPYSSSLTSVLQYLPIDMENIARPLMKIFVHANQIRSFFGLVCAEYVSSCHDVNTLFRSQSMASKVMYELMKFVGHDYLVISLKPLIDLIYAERKCCEIDPSKLKPGDSLEHNLRNITVYAELAFSRVVDSHQRCPGILREVFAELRDVVQKYFPGRDDVARLALSSFLIMRFFAAAILNPKLFSLKRDTPDADVSRTLVLVSKILQRLANCVVSAHPLTTKEQWLSPVLLRFLDDAHKTAMINFLDGISTDNSFLNDENASPDGGTPPTLLKHGHMIERRIGLDKKRSLKNFILKKNRFVTLTENQLSWQKAKDTPSLSSPSEISSDDLQKGFPLSDITSVSPLPEQKHCFRVSTQTNEVHFQANTAGEMNEWVILIQKQQRRHIMLLNRPSNEQNQILSSPAADVDMEREMQIIHSYFCEHSSTFEQWRNTLVQNKDAFKRQLQPISAISMTRDESPRNSNAGVVTLPLEKMFENSAATDDEREFCLSSLHETLTSIINAIQQVEQAHHSAKDVSYQMLQQQGMHGKHAEMCENSLHPLSPGKDQDNADFSSLIPSVISGQKLIDNENYLHLRQRKRIKTSSSSHPIPATALFLPTSTINENRKQLELSSLKTTNI